MKRVFSNNPEGPEPPARVFSEPPGEEATVPGDSRAQNASAPRRNRSAVVFSQPQSPGEKEASPIIRAGNTFISALTEKHRATVERLRSRTEKPPTPPVEPDKKQEDKD